MDGLEQSLGNAGFFQHCAHENEQRQGGQNVVARDILHLGDELEHGLVAEPHDPENEAYAHQRIGHRDAQEDQHQQRREHHQRDIHQPRPPSTEGSSPRPETNTAPDFSISASICAAKSTKPATKVARKGQTTGFQALSPDNSPLV